MSRIPQEAIERLAYEDAETADLEELEAAGAIWDRLVADPDEVWADGENGPDPLDVPDTGPYPPLRPGDFGYGMVEIDGIVSRIEHPELSVRLHLEGPEGNAFFILGLVRRTLREAGHPGDAERFLGEAQQGDYAHLLATVRRFVDVR